MRVPFEKNKARKLSDEDIQRIYDLYSFGETIMGIARELGVRRMTIYHHVYKRFFPEKFAEMEHQKVIRNRQYEKKKADHKDYLKRLKETHGKIEVSRHRQKVKDKWIKENNEKWLEQRRKYRTKNKKRINANWMKIYHKKKLESQDKL